MKLHKLFQLSLTTEEFTILLRQSGIDIPDGVALRAATSEDNINVMWEVESTVPPRQEPVPEVPVQAEKTKHEEPIPLRRCQICQSSIDLRPASALTCDDAECRKELKNRQQRAYRARKAEEAAAKKACPVCKDTFIATVKHRKLCGKASCRSEYKRTVWDPARKAKKEATVPPTQEELKAIEEEINGVAAKGSDDAEFKVIVYGGEPHRWMSSVTIPEDIELMAVPKQRGKRGSAARVAKAIASGTCSAVGVMTAFVGHGDCDVIKRACRRHDVHFKICNSTQAVRDFLTDSAWREA